MGKIPRREAQYPTLSDQHLLTRYTDILHPGDSINTFAVLYMGKNNFKGGYELG